MGCVHSNSAADLARPNLFQRNLCVHHKIPAAEVYTTLGELGRGAFGVVDRVEHIQTKKQFAMKTLTFASGSKRSEFEKEIDILRGLHHPSIVRMVETFEDGHHFYIIMELASGGTVGGAARTVGMEMRSVVVFFSMLTLHSLLRAACSFWTKSKPKVRQTPQTNSHLGFAGAFTHSPYHLHSVLGIPLFIIAGKEFPEDTVRIVIARLASVIQYLHSRFICVRLSLASHSSRSLARLHDNATPAPRPQAGEYPRRVPGARRLYQALRVRC